MTTYSSNGITYRVMFARSMQTGTGTTVLAQSPETDLSVTSGIARLTDDEVARLRNAGRVALALATKPADGSAESVDTVNVAKEAEQACLQEFAEKYFPTADSSEGKA